MLQVKIKKLHPNAVIPAYATEGAGCFDICAIGTLQPALDPLMDQFGLPVNQGSPVTFRTGLAFEIPPGWALLIFSRSGAGFNHSTRLENGTGIIDSDYRGELLVSVIRDISWRDTFVVKRGDRIAQGMIVKVPSVNFIESDELSETRRGSGGRGSTGR